MTERQKFTVIKTLGDVEIRQYPAHLTADVVVEGDTQSAGNRGFRPLANYIFSNNIAMTAPVIVEEQKQNQTLVSFVMPGDRSYDEMPVPNDPVMLREHGSEICAVISFRGYTTAHKVRRMETRLRQVLKSEAIEICGKPRVARFDPPWKPGFARHNEIVMPINEKAWES